MRGIIKRIGRYGQFQAKAAEVIENFNDGLL
jgi:hypothetical protein